MSAGNDSLTDEERLSRAETACGYRFRDRALLRRALTHPSFDEGTSNDPGYERLEFLGDAVISLVVAEELYARFPDLREGALTRLKIGAVSGPVLTQAAEELGIADVLFVGAGERRSGGRGRASALENAFEALAAAIYLDGGLAPAQSFVRRTLGNRIDENAAVPPNPKGELQEYLQASGEEPVYRILAVEGPPHDRVFTASVGRGDVILGEGLGRSKKEAEMHAAIAALARLAGQDEGHQTPA